MTKGMHRIRLGNIKHVAFSLPKWLCDKYPSADFCVDRLNGVKLDHLEKVLDEEEVYECHLYDLSMEDMKRLLEGCERRGIRITPKAYSEYYPNATMAYRFELMSKEQRDEYLIDTQGVCMVCGDRRGLTINYDCWALSADVATKIVLCSKHNSELFHSPKYEKLLLEFLKRSDENLNEAIATSDIYTHSFGRDERQMG